MKIILFKLFNRTFGVIFRSIQKTLEIKNPPLKLHYLVNQMAIQDSAEYAVSNFSEALIFRSREKLWNYCMKRIPNLQIEGGIIAEFGVWKGASINYFAKKCPKTQIYGFDSFEGLEEDWHGFVLSKGTFSTYGKMPECEKNVTLYKGCFENTLPGFIEKLDHAKIQILHMDADTYKPTAFVLNSLSKNLGPGTIIIFDEYFGYPNFRSHEFKAWNEFVNSTQIKFRYIGYTEQQVAVEIL